MSSSSDDAKVVVAFLLAYRKSQEKRKYFPKINTVSGDYNKAVVRKIAESANLHHVAEKRDSTGICFIGERKFQDFISEVCIEFFLFQ
ncbi:tRNA-specific 2-thiouridylase MnmA [Portunus trituberculatus]|uniref:tRNA-specific 2-thiouridylase MnmA n=1 Tax=Portunus trituberculatus TaxID=210409 RepID=A0A5B7E909_PORTR|nr:tRNA-specific 2-thiouridylase MnmA [Portunus trituberculatus]